MIHSDTDMCAVPLEGLWWSNLHLWAGRATCHPMQQQRVSNFSHLQKRSHLTTAQQSDGHQRTPRGRTHTDVSSRDLPDNRVRPTRARRPNELDCVGGGQTRPKQFVVFLFCSVLLITESEYSTDNLSLTSAVLG